MDLTSTSSISKSRWLLSLLAFLTYSESHAFETKRFDALPPKRPGYLSFAAPPTLRFAPAPIVADRRNLLLPSVVTPSAEINLIETNATVEESDFPVTDYSESPEEEVEAPDLGNLEIPQVAPPMELPLADPFSAANSDAINSTDELMKVFDRSKIDAGNARIAIPFVPPYTVAPESMKISSRSTYRRVRR